MQKMLLLFLVGAFGVVACNTGEKKTAAGADVVKDSSFVVSGKIQGLDTGWVYFFNIQNEQQAKPDSARVTGGSFEFKGHAATPYFAILALNELSGRRQQPLGFFVEPGKINISTTRDSLANGSVTGGTTQSEYNRFFAAYKAIEDKQRALANDYQAASMAGDMAKMEKAQKDFEGLEKENKELVAKFARENGDSYVSPFLVAQSFAQEVNLEELDPLYSAFSEKIKNSYFGKIIKKALDASRATAVGSVAPEFALNDVSGKPVTLSSYKGKYLLIDFWASWCMPCRMENPNVVKAYNQYKGKGFDILGVSLDNDKDKWEQAIKKDQLTWTHVSELNGWQSEVARLYDVQAIPANYLLDKEGKIVAKNLRSEDLVKKLNEVLN